jgi:hypothetical protein
MENNNCNIKYKLLNINALFSSIYKIIVILMIYVLFENNDYILLKNENINKIY